MKVKIESTDTGWNVYFENKVAEHLSYEEMLGLVASITMPTNKRCLNWLEPIKK